MQINSFFPLKLKKWFGVLQEYPIVNNILLYDIRIGGVDCTVGFVKMTLMNLTYLKVVPVC